MGLFDGDYKMSGVERVEADRSRAVDEAYASREAAELELCLCGVGGANPAVLCARCAAIDEAEASDE